METQRLIWYFLSNCLNFLFFSNSLINSLLKWSCESQFLYLLFFIFFELCRCSITSLCLDFQIQGAESNLHFTSPLPEQIEAMYNEGASEFVVDQGLYYPTATNYGYYCTGKLTSPIFCRLGLCLVVSYLCILFIGCGQDLSHPANGRTTIGFLVQMVQISSTR